MQVLEDFSIWFLLINALPKLNYPLITYYRYYQRDLNPQSAPTASYHGLIIAVNI